MKSYYSFALSLALLVALAVGLLAGGVWLLQETFG